MPRPSSSASWRPTSRRRCRRTTSRRRPPAAAAMFLRFLAASCIAGFCCPAVAHQGSIDARVCTECTPPHGVDAERTDPRMPSVTRAHAMRCTVDGEPDVAPIRCPRTASRRPGSTMADLTDAKPDPGLPRPCRCGCPSSGVRRGMRKRMAWVCLCMYAQVFCE